jgi:hypothetical protein
VAVGDEALTSLNGTTAFDGANTALGSIALTAETSGEENVAVGRRALETLTTGNNNTSVGWRSGDLATTGNFGTYIGSQAGFGITTANNNIVIGTLSGVHTVFGQVDNACYVANIFGAPIDAGTATIVGVDSNGKLGTVAVDAVGNRVPVSSLLGRQPQTIPEPQAVPQGAKPEAMLNRKVDKLQATVMQQKKQIETLTAQLKEQAAQIQKVSAQIQMNKPAAKVVKNNE